MEGGYVLTVALPSLAILLFLLATGMWIAAALLGLGLFIVVFVLHSPVIFLGMAGFNLMNSFTLSALPLFVLMGSLLAESGLMRPIYQLITGLFGWIPGGLIQSNILSSAVFSTMIGNSHACAATVATMAIPEQIDRLGYDKRMVLGSVCGGALLGPLIPPSVHMIICGAWLGESVAKLFLSGVIPGLIVMVLSCVYIAVRTSITPSLLPERGKLDFKEALAGARGAWPTVFVIFCALFTIYLGIATPTEAGALSVVATLVILAARNRLRWRLLKKAGLDTVRVLGMMLFILVAAVFYAYALSMLKIPQEFSQLMIRSGMSHYAIVWLLVLMYVILGTFLPGLEMLLITLPFVAPILTSLGYNLIFVAVFTLFGTLLGNLTPPVALILFVVQSVSTEKRSTLQDVAVGAMPYWFVIGAAWTLLIYFPEIATWLPSVIRG